MDDILAQAIAKDPVPTDVVLVSDPTSGVAGKSTIAQILGTFTELDAKTPLVTDLVPVADPVTGVAGKSTVEELLMGDKNSVVSVFPASSDIKLTCFRGIGVNSVTSGSRTASYPLFLGGKIPYPQGVRFNLSGTPNGSDYQSEIQSIIINAKYLSQDISTISNFGMATSISAPNLVEGNINFSNGISLTSVSFPEFVSGTISINNTASLTGTLTFPKLKVGTINFQSATALTGISLPEFESGEIVAAFGGSTTFPNFTTFSAPKLKYASSISLTSLSSISFPALETATGGISVNSSLIASFDLPSLVLCGNVFNSAGSHPLLTNVNLPKLKYAVFGIVQSSNSINFSLLTSLNFPELINSGLPVILVPSGISKSIGFNTSNNLTITASSPNLATINLPKLEFASGTNSFNITAAPALSTFTINPTPKFIFGNFIVTGAALDQASVDGILVALAYQDGVANAPYPAYSSKTVNLSGGTSATPSATGLAAKATLVARGCTVTHN